MGRWSLTPMAASPRSRAAATYSAGVPVACPHRAVCVW